MFINNDFLLRCFGLKAVVSPLRTHRRYRSIALNRRLFYVILWPNWPQKNYSVVTWALWGLKSLVTQLLVQEVNRWYQCSALLFLCVWNQPVTDWLSSHVVQVKFIIPISFLSHGRWGKLRAEWCYPWNISNLESMPAFVYRTNNKIRFLLIVQPWLLTYVKKSYPSCLLSVRKRTYLFVPWEYHQIKRHWYDMYGIHMIAYIHIHMHVCVCAEIIMEPLLLKSLFLQ